MALSLKRCGVRFDPPAIIVTYVNKSGGGKLHRRTMPLRNFNKKSGIHRVTEDLKSNDRHSKYLEQIPLHQLEKLITVIHDKMNGLSLQESLKKNEEMDRLNPEEDLNLVDEETLKRKKAVMEESFSKSSKKIGDKDFTYDVEVDFEGAIESCDWDSGSDNEF